MVFQIKDKNGKKQYSPLSEILDHIKITLTDIKLDQLKKKKSKNSVDPVKNPIDSVRNPIDSEDDIVLPTKKNKRKNNSSNDPPKRKRSNTNPFSINPEDCYKSLAANYIPQLVELLSKLFNI